MGIDRTGSTSQLDIIRLNKGSFELQRFFDKKAMHTLYEAVDLINDEALHFCSLYVLKSRISNYDIYYYLNYRNKTALQIIDMLLNKKTAEIDKLYVQNRKIMYKYLKWILNTGFYDDGFNNEYDEILDLCAILLIKKYNDKTVLPHAADMIFKRHNKGCYIYDLIWAFFESENRESLIYIAGRLGSENPLEATLAKKLLKFIPGIDKSENRNSTNLFPYAKRWLEENGPFLEYTGESFQQTFNPLFYVLSLRLKYLCKPFDKNNKNRFEIMSGPEKNKVEKFEKLNVNYQFLLSRCSYLMHKRNKQLWNKWFLMPVEQQIRYARRFLGRGGYTW